MKGWVCCRDGRVAVYWDSHDGLIPHIHGKSINYELYLETVSMN